MMKQFSWNALTGTGSLTLPNSLKGAFRELSLFGQSEQVSTTGMQLLPLLHDITSETGENKLIIEKSNIKIDVKTVNGNDTSNDIYIFGNKNSKEESGYEDVSKYLPAGEYTIFSNFENAFSFVVAWRNGKSITLVDVLSPRPTTFTINEGDKLRIALRPTKIMIDNGSFIVNKGSTATDYEPYTGGKPSPSIEYPQEIINVGRKSRNLFDTNNIDDTKCVTTNSNVAFSYDPLYVLSNIILVKQGQKIVKGNTGSKMCIFLDANKEPILSTKVSAEDGKTIEVPSGAHYFCFNILKTNLNNNVMCNIGDKLLVYEPYTDKNLIDVQVTGKNLFPYSNDFSDWKKYLNDSYFENVTNDERSLTSIALKTYACIKSPTFKLKPNTTYTISGVIDTIDKSKNIGVRAFKNLDVSDHLKMLAVARRKSTNETQKVSATFTTDDLKDTNEVYIQLDCSWSDTVLPTTVTFSDIQLESGNKATEYEEYKEQVITLQLDRPLTKWDRIEKRDGVWGVVYCTGVYEDIRESDISTNSINDQYGRYYINAIKAYKNAECLCNIAEYSQTQKEDKCGFWWSDTLCLFISSEYTGNNGTEDYSTAIKNFKENVLSKGITVFYKLNTEEFVPFSEDLQTELNNLHTYNGTTNIYVDSGDVEAGIKVTYRKKV